MLWASQVAPGKTNGLKLRIYGERAGLEWSQEHPEELLFTPLGEPSRIYRRGGSGLSASANRATRLPGGHHAFLDVTFRKARQYAAFGLDFLELLPRSFAKRRRQSFDGS